MLSCFIIDDEPGAVAILRTFVANTPFLALAGSTTNALDGIAYLRQEPVDLLLLDIHLPQLSGLDVMRLVAPATKVILTTAHSEFAVQGFELDALDYLLKPIAFERFVKAAQKALPAPAGPLAAPSPAGYVFVKTEGKGKLTKVCFADILYIEGLKNYVAIQTTQQRIVTLLTLKDLEARLPAAQFRRVHKSYIVSLDQIQALDGNQLLFRQPKASVPLSETYRTAFFEALNQHLLEGKR